MTAYYMRIITASGAPLTDANGNNWFIVNLPASEISNSISLTSGPAPSGTTAFSPLEFSFQAVASLQSTLLGDLLAGTQIKNVEIAAYTSSAPTGTLINEYFYTGVQATAMSVGANGDTLDLSYGSSEIEHYASLTSPPTTATWSTVTQTDQLSGSGTPVNPSHPPSDSFSTSVGDLQGAPSLTYYAKFGSTWIAITNPSFSVTNNGTLKFGTLSLQLGGTSNTSVTLLHDLESGTSPGKFEIAAYNGSGKLVDDFTFGDTAITAAEPTSPGTSAESFNFIYEQMQDAQTSYNQALQAQTVVSGWNLLNNTSDTSLGSTAPATAPSASPSSSPGVYYLRIITANGQQLADARGQSWFTVDLPTSDITSSVTFLNGHVLPGTTAFSPLEFSLPINASLQATLLGDLLAGTQIKDVEIAGYSASGPTGTLVDDYLYTGVKATALSLGASGDTLDLTYGSTEIEHYSAPTSPPTTATWSSVTNNEQLYVSGTPIHQGAPPSSTLIGSLLQGTPSLSYYVKVGSTWLEITNPSFSVTNNGTLKFGALSLQFAGTSNTGVTLLQDLESGASPGKIEIAAYNGVGKLVEDYTFGDVGITAAAPTSPGTSAESFNFVYEQMQDAQTSYDSSGQALTPVVSGWNLVTNTSDTSLGSTAPATSPLSSALLSPSVYYVQFIGANGQQLRDANGHNWFTVDLPVSDIAKTLTFVGNGFVGSAPAFSALEFNFGTGAALQPKLLGDLLTGTQIKDVEIAGYSSSSSTGTLVDDYFYTGVNVTGMAVTPDGNTVDMTYGSTEVEHYSAPTSPPTKAIWSSVTDTEQLSGSGSPVNQGPPPGNSFTTSVGSMQASPTLTYYAEFGSLTGDLGNSWIAIADPSFSLTNTGKVQFGTLSLDFLSQNKASVQLLADLEQTQPLTKLEIAAYNPGGKLVDDYTFGDVGIKDATPTSPGATTEAFDFIFGKMQDAHTSYVNGQAQTPEINGWNILINTSDTILGSSAPATVSEIPPCYCPGTLIATDRGERAVESLAIGDRVVTASGAARPIKWIGRRDYSGRFLLGRKDILPVCIKAGALDEGLPRRDLFISPHHAMYLEGVLIEARDLVNGVTIVQADKVDTVSYIHIELDSHDVIIAEGARSESFVDDDSRGQFHNAHEFTALYPDEARTPARYCAPRLAGGYRVAAARRHIARRAGLGPARDEIRAGSLHGFVDRAGPDGIFGWAQDLDHPETPVCLDVYADGRLIGRTLANRYRRDLEAAGFGSGHHAFAFVPPSDPPCSIGRVEVRRSLDGAPLLLSRAVRAAMAA
jgi:hypothetical protein